MTLPSDPPDKDALISALMARIEALVEQNAQLTARIAELEATLGLPPKTPDNSSTPPSKGQKPSGPSAAKANPHAGAHRPLHPNPTAKRDVFAATCRGCGADVSGAPQRVCDRIRVQVDRRPHPAIDRLLPPVQRPERSTSRQISKSILVG